ncbi:MAG: thrombospondin type 3 repeat-containing protein [Tepidiformaceae bacterium]
MSAQVPPPINALFYGPTSGGLAATTPNLIATVWDEPTWSAKTTSDFEAFDVIVFGDQPECFEDASRWNTAIANRQVWGAAVSGNIFVDGTDPDFHNKTLFAHQATTFAAADPSDGPGLYVSLSCVYHYGTNPGPELFELLEPFGVFIARSVGDETLCPNDAHKIADHPALDGLNDAYLSNWDCSAHAVFDSWPGDFSPLAIIEDALPLPPYTAPDGSTGSVYILARGAAPYCPITVDDDDGDCLTNAIETEIGTDPDDEDTDSDGLLDPWEVHPDTPGAGFRLSSGITVDQDQVLGPFWPSKFFFAACSADQELRVTAGMCFNFRPDPLHKDVYLEIDWQDCHVGHECPEVISSSDDPLHHSPNIGGLSDLVAMFRSAPVGNPDAENGVNLHILIDESIPHRPNCDQDSAIGRAEHFGTPWQRRNPAVIEARELAVRYVWSGHSSAHDDSGTCPNPDPVDFAFQGIGINPLKSYDYTPFGDASVGGRDILITLGPLWSCSSEIGKGDGLGQFFGPCFRETITSLNGVYIPDPGIFPARVPVPGQGTIGWSHPVNRLLGEREHDGIRQLWSRSLAHLLGHSLGLSSHSEVRNDPAPAGRHQADPDSPLTPLTPEQYGPAHVWMDLIDAPSGGGFPMAEPGPDYSLLANTDTNLSDPDNDGVLEHDDNCPGVHNPNQKNTDFGPWLLKLLGGSELNVLEFGDACDPDIDGDGKRNPLPGSGFGAVLAASTEDDLFPLDSNDDGEDNATDADDDGDGVADAVDNCALTPNPSQSDLNADDVGDACDIDPDGDGWPTSVEALLGSSPMDALAAPEYVGVGSVCTDGIDNDADSVADGADAGCIDTDMDGASDADDNCSNFANPGQADHDQNGIGDACELQVRVVYLDSPVLAAGSIARLGWSATEPGTFSVRRGDCSTGSALDAGAYDPGAGEEPEPAFMTIQSAELIEGVNTISVCMLSASGQRSAATTIVLDTIVPETTIVSGPAEGSVSGADVSFAFVASELAGFECSLDFAQFGQCESPVALTALQNGSHTFRVRAIDVAANLDPSAASRTWTVATGPTVYRVPIASVSTSSLIGATVANLSDDPDAPDGAWATAPSAIDVGMLVEFEVAAGELVAGPGLQEFRILMRKNAPGGNPPSYSISMWTVTGGFYYFIDFADHVILTTDTTVVISVTWDASAIPFDQDSFVRLSIGGWASGNPKPQKRTVEFGAVEWNATVE